MTADDRFEALGLVLPPAPGPLGVYKPFFQLGPMIYVSGHGTVQADGTLIIGKVGVDLNTEAAYGAAQVVGLAILATLKENLGSLDHIDQVAKILGMVNCVSDFESHPYVINGCSELFAKVWGSDKGVGVRSAIGVGSLPDNIPEEIEAQFLLK